MKNRTKTIVLCVLVISVIAAGLVSIEAIHKETMLSFRDIMNRTIEMYQKAFAMLRERQELVVEGYITAADFIENTERVLVMERSGVDIKGTESQQYLNNYLRKRFDRIKSGVVDYYLLSPQYRILADREDKFTGLVSEARFKDEPLIKRAFVGKYGFATLHDDYKSEKNRTTRYKILKFFQISPVKKDGKVIAVLINSVAISDAIDDVVNAGWFGKTAEIYIVDKRGVMISDSRFTYELVHAGMLDAGAGSANNIRVADPGTDLLKGFGHPEEQDKMPLTFMAADLIKGHSDFNFDGYRNYLGTEVIGVWQWIKDLNIGMVFEISLEEAYEDFYAVRDVIFMIIAFMFTVFGVLIFLLTSMQKKGADELQRAYDDLAIVINERTRELRDAKADLEDANRELSEMATIDKLTGLDNRRSLMMKMDKEWRRCMRNEEEISVAMIDVDFFKRYNDCYGHLKGDECLSRVASVLADNRFLSRPGDIVARYGGEEFSIVLSGASEEDAAFICDKVIDAIGRENIPHEKSGVEGIHHVTVSVGVASEVPGRFSNPEDLFEKADQALYEAKNCGRNQVICFNEIDQ